MGVKVNKKYTEIANIVNKEMKRLFYNKGISVHDFLINDPEGRKFIDQIKNIIKYYSNTKKKEILSGLVEFLTKYKELKDNNLLNV